MPTDERLFRESILEGDTVRVLAERHEMAVATVHRAIKRGAEAFVRDFHMQLLASHATGDLPALLFPNQPGPTLDRALDIMRWLTNELEQRGMPVRIHYRPALDGSLTICFSDANPPEGSRARPDLLDDQKETPE